MPQPSAKWTNAAPSHYYEACESGEEYEELEDYAVKDTEVGIFVAYKPPRRDEACRICKILDGRGDTHQLYDLHLHNFPTGCPRYIAMSVDERFKMACDANLCLRCHDPSYVRKANDQNHKQFCQILVRGKGRFSCQSQGCNTHLWICLRHKPDNARTLQKFKEEYQAKFNLEFGLAIIVPMFVKHSKVNRKEKKKLNVAKNIDSKNKIKVGQVPNSEVLPDPVTSSSNGPGDENSMTVKKPKNLSSNQALKKLKNKICSKGSDKENVRPVPKGRAQFIIGYTKGKTRGLLTLYDTGCGSVLFKDGVPQKELGSVLKTKGPFLVKGVGDTSVKVNDEVMCAVSLVDSMKQALKG